MAAPVNQYKNQQGDGVHIERDIILNPGEFPQRNVDNQIVAVPAGTEGQVPTYQADGTLAPADNASGGGDLLAVNNLNDLDDFPTARTNLGLGTAATKDTGSGANNIPVLSATPGTPDGTKFLRDDGTWQTPSGGGGSGTERVEFELTSTTIPDNSETAFVGVSVKSGYSLPSWANLVGTTIELEAGAVYLVKPRINWNVSSATGSVSFTSGPFGAGIQATASYPAIGLVGNRHYFVDTIAGVGFAALTIAPKVRQTSGVSQDADGEIWIIRLGTMTDSVEV